MLTGKNEATNELTRSTRPEARYWKAPISFKFGNFTSETIPQISHLNLIGIDGLEALFTEASWLGLAVFIVCYHRTTLCFEVNSRRGTHTSFVHQILSAISVLQSQISLSLCA